MRKKHFGSREMGIITIKAVTDNTDTSVRVFTTLEDEDL